MEKTEEYINTRYDGKDNSPSVIQFRLSNDELIYSIYRELMGYTAFDTNTNQWIRPPGAIPIMEEEGINHYMRIIKQILHPSAALSNTTQKDINDIGINISIQTLDFITYNSTRYNIEQWSWSFLMGCVVNNVQQFLTRAKNGRENELLTQGFTHTENVQSRAEVDEGSTQPRSLLPINPFRGRAR